MKRGTFADDDVADPAAWESHMLQLAAKQNVRDVELTTLQEQNGELTVRGEELGKKIAYYTKQMEVLVRENQDLKSSDSRNKNASTDYLKNVVVKFLCETKDATRSKMVPAIAMILNLTDTELDMIYRANRGWKR